MMYPFADYWPQFVAGLNIVLCLIASGHAILYKRDARAVIGWVGIIWLSPFLGALLYAAFGVNRIRRRAVSLRAVAPPTQMADERESCSGEVLLQTLGPQGIHLEALQRVVQKATGHPLLGGNRVEPLLHGDQAYPAMLQAIDEAGQTISLSTYIFDNDRAGRMFLEALRRAVARGVQVRVLVDDVGARYSWPPMVRILRQAGIPLARFMRTVVPWGLRYTNLRSHRKILVADGRVGFTGGINIRQGHILQDTPRHPIQDLHFRIEGPVVAQLQETFVADWYFCTGETLDGEAWFPVIKPSGPVLARGIPDGPDEDFEKLQMTLLGAIACARESLKIVTPYFLPDAGLITALNVAAMRDVQVDIVLPQRSNLMLVQWASSALLWQVLQRGCRVWLSPPPFDHTKLMLVDGLWSLIGSANWDPRSLRLNFEFNVECYDGELAGQLSQLVARKQEASRRISLQDVDARPLPIKLRDGLARLASPYL